MGLDTLVRMGDILDFLREDDRGRTAYIRDPKDPTQAEPFEVPISKRLRVALDAVPKTESPYYFPRRRQAATEEGRRMVLRSALKRACEAARLAYGRKRGGITFHWGTRRTGASRMIQRKVDIKTVQAIGHWKHPDVVLEIYAETTTAAMRRAVELIGPHSQSIPGRARK
jgi:integrase